MTPRTPRAPTTPGHTPQQGDSSPGQRPMQQQQPAGRDRARGSHDLGGQRTPATPQAGSDDRDTHQAGWTDVDDDDAPPR
jgi:hypothetical protein